MSQRPHEVLIAGAGMAGLAAAERLAAAGVDALLLEARDRPGGRVWTDREFAGLPVELGAEFLHGDRVATWEYVRELGLETLLWQKTADSLVSTEDGEWLTMERARATYPDLDITRSWNLPKVPAHRHEDLGSYLRRIGFDRKQLRYVERWFANAQGESMRFLSAAATVEALAYDGNGLGDYRLLGGYDAVVDHLAKSAHVRLNAQITAVDWREDGVTVKTRGGDAFEGRSLLVTLPVGVLHSGSIRFTPDLDEGKQQALAGVRMGPVIKMLFRFAEPIAAPEIMAIYSRNNPPMWWSPSFRPIEGAGSNGAHVWTAFVSGSGAASLLSMGESAALDAAVAALSADLGRTLEPLDARLVDWPGDPYSRGGYSFVLPGHDGARELLAKPAPPLFFAGEATAPEHSSATVHGAIVSGRRAAEEVLAFLGRGSETRVLA